MTKYRRTAGTMATLCAAAAVLTTADAAQAHPGHEEPRPPAQAGGVARAVAAQIHRYAEPEAALADGFVRIPGCVDDADGEATMGEHWVRFDRIDHAVRLTEPEVLLYLPTGGGTHRLVGAEYVSTSPGAHLAGVPLEQGPGPTSALHVWTVPNSSGTFFPFNPDLSCGVGD